MPSRKDLLQAHRLMTQRAALALIAGDPDSPNQPLRRRNTATISAVLAGVIVAGVFAVLGLLSPGTVSGLTKAGTLVIDKDTATPYVPCQGDELCPSLNYASALLALDTSSVNRVDVTQATLSGYKIGPAIGIAGLPQDLPTSADLVKGPWAVCADDDVSTLVGGVPVGGTPLSADEATLVTTTAGGDWVLWQGERLKIAPGVMLTLFGGGTPPTVPAVPVGWLNAIPQGPDFTAPAISGQGTAVHGPSGSALAGQVYMVAGGGGTPTLYYVLERNGQLAAVTPVQAALLDREQGAGKAQQISPSQAANDLAPGGGIPAGGLPATLPRLAALSSPTCVTYGTGLTRQITTGGTVPANAVPTAGGSAGVDQVWLPPDHGALVGVVPSAGSSAPVSSWFLITGATRYGLSSPGVAAVLGYQLSSDQTKLPASLVQLIPQGKSLDPTAATVKASSLDAGSARSVTI
jgi:type VII secretion protein EccB